MWLGGAWVDMWGYASGAMEVPWRYYAIPLESEVINVGVRPYTAILKQS